MQCKIFQSKLQKSKTSNSNLNQRYRRKKREQKYLMRKQNSGKRRPWISKNTIMRHRINRTNRLLRTEQSALI